MLKKKELSVGGEKKLFLSLDMCNLKDNNAVMFKKMLSLLERGAWLSWATFKYEPNM